MREKVYYVNHIGEIVEMRRGGIAVDANDLRDYDWTVVESNQKIAGFKSGIKQRKLPAVVTAPTKAAFVRLRNNANRIFSRDVEAMIPGRLYLNDCYMKCYITAAVNEDYYYGKNVTRTEWTVTTDKPTWYKEKEFDFAAYENTSGSGLNYPHNYPFNYSESSGAGSILNDSATPADFRMIIYGPCVNPQVTIGSHPYKVNVEVGQGEYLQIDSAEEKIKLVSALGNESNCFKYRDRENSVFRKLPEGEAAVIWNGEFKFNLIVMERRVEPEWA